MRTIDLTGKLGLQPRPTIKIGDKILNVDDSAPTILRMLDLLGDNPERVSPATINEAAKLLFDPKSYKTLEAMKLSFSDFALVISTAMELVTGGGAEGEQGIPDTTS